MADIAVRFLLNKLPLLMEKLTTLLLDDKSLSGVKDKINSLTKELQIIDLFLKSSEGKRDNDLVKLLVTQIRDVVHRAEDVIDTYVVSVIEHRSKSVFKKSPHLIELDDVDLQIKKIKSSIDEIYENKGRYSIGEDEFRREEEKEVMESLRERRRDVEEEHVVGLVLHDDSAVIKQLKETDSRLRVVSIIGTGGLGKTTLARKIYNNAEVKELFPCSAWGYVSNDYRPMELLLSLYKCFQLSANYHNLNEDDLRTRVRGFLEGKKYLIVLDDIWETQVWDKIKDVFPVEQNGSRILITSRTKKVAFHCGTTTPYYLPFLNKEESWELFSKKVFEGEECPSHLERMGRSIAESCRGLPLGIVVLAGLVRRKERSEREWRRMMEISWHLSQDKTEVMNILKLSYDSLPRRLKPCFLYFAIYCEDSDINARELMELWIAEGFIQPRDIGNPNPVEVEDIAEYYLHELVDRSLVQVAKRRIDGGVKICRIHKLLHDLCIAESKSNGLLEVSTEANKGTLINARRLCLHWGAQSYLSSGKFSQSSIRTFLFFSSEEFPRSDLVMENFQLTRVLCAKAAMFSSLSTHPKTLIHLKYLKTSTKDRDIPASICSLWNLGTLHLTSPETELFEEERKSHRLKEMERCKLSSLTNLRSIKLRNFERLPLEFPSNVVKITLEGTHMEDNKDIMKTLGRLTNLQILKLGGFLGPFDLIFVDGQFPRLRLFQMTEMDARTWSLEEGAMPKLQYVLIKGCYYLDALPVRLWSLTDLRQVRVVRSNKRLENSLEEVTLRNGCELIIPHDYDSLRPKWWSR